VTLICLSGAADAVVCKHHALGGEGAVELAKAVIKATETPPHFKFLYELDLPIKVNRPWSPKRGISFLSTYPKDHGCTHTAI